MNNLAYLFQALSFAMLFYACFYVVYLWVIEEKINKRAFFRGFCVVSLLNLSAYLAVELTK